MDVSVEAALASGRARSVGRAPSVVTVKRKAGNVAQDETSGVEAQTWTVIVDTSPARLAEFGAGAAGRNRPQRPGGVVWEQADRTLHLPAPLATLHDGDTVNITAGENAGTYWRILEATWADQRTAYRLPVVQIDIPENW